MTPKPDRSSRKWLQRGCLCTVSLSTISNPCSSYEILSDGNKRAVYDAHGIEGLSGPGGGGHGMDAEEIFAQFFGHQMFGFDFGPDARRSKGENSVIPHEVTLEDLYNGKSVKMNMEKEVVCSVCKGYSKLDFTLSTV